MRSEGSAGMTAVLAAFVGAALAFPHCLGMCGAFALHLGRESPGGGGASRWRGLDRQLCWHAGRIVTYVFLGSLAAFAGGSLLLIGAIPGVQKALAVVLGAFMMVMGLALMGARPVRWGGGGTEDGLFASFVRPFFGAPTRLGALTLGLVSGFLPCPIVLGFLALGAQSGSVLMGMAIMGAMGLGTVWSLVALGMTGGLAGARLGRWGGVLAGLILIVLGAATGLRATNVFHWLLGCPPGVQAPATPGESKSCCEPPAADERNSSQER